MQAYVVRKDCEMTELTKVSKNTKVSPDIMAHLLLRFSGVNPTQQSAMLSSCDNKCDYEEFKKALRMQHANIHKIRHTPPTTTKGHHKGGYKGGKSAGKGKFRTYAAEADEEQWDWPADEVDPADSASQVEVGGAASGSSSPRPSEIAGAYEATAEEELSLMDECLHAGQE